MGKTYLLTQILAAGSGVVAAIDKYTRTTESCGGKGTAWPLSQEERTLTLALPGFYCFSGHITLRMILIHYAQVQLGGYRKQRRGCCQLHKRGRIFANVKGKVFELVTPILGRFSIDFRKLL